MDQKYYRGITLRKFCPYERVATLLNNEFRQRSSDYQGCVVRFLKIGSKEVNVPPLVLKATQTDVNFGFSADLRLAALAAETLEGEVAITTKASKVKTKSFIVRNCMATCEYPIVSKLHNMNDVNVELAFPECFTTINGVKELRVGDGVPMIGIQRPFYQYRIFNYGESIEIFGPKAISAYRTDFGCVIGDKVFRVCVSDGMDANALLAKDEAVIEASGDKEANEKTPSLQKMECFLRFPNGDFERYTLQQKALLKEGVPLSAAASWQLLNLLCYFEYIPDEEKASCDFYDEQSNSILVDIIRVGERYYLASHVVDFFHQRCASNVFLRKLFQNLKFTDDELLLRDKSGNFGILSSVSGSVSCFVMSLAYYWGMLCGGSWTSFVGAFNSISECGLFTVEKGARIVGCTSQKLKEALKVAILSPDGYYTMRVVRSDRDLSHAKPNHLYIVGFDPSATVNKQTGEPDHYVVGVVTSEGKIKVLFDPLDSAWTAGNDITPVSANPDFTLIDFNGDVQTPNRLSYSMSTFEVVV